MGHGRGAGALRRARAEARRRDRRAARALRRRRGRVPGGRRVPDVLHADDVAAGVPNAEDRVQLAGRAHQHDADARVPRCGPARGDAPRRAHARHRRRRARPRSGRDPAQELHPGRRVPVHDGHRRHLRLRRVRQAARPRCSSTPATTSCAPNRPRAANATTRSCSASALSCYVEITAPVGLYREWGKVEIEDDGKVLAYVGTSAHGQGHETAFSMIVSDVLGVPMDDIRIVQSDTKLIPQGQGTGGSRSLQIAGSASEGRERRGARRRPSSSPRTCFEANPDDVVLGDGGLQVAGVPARVAVVAGPRAGGEGRRPPPGEHGSAARARAHLRRGFVVVPVRRAHRGRRDRPRHRPRRAAPAHRGGRLRPHRQPDARRGSAARRHRAGRRAGALRTRAVRRGRQPDHRQPHGLRDAVGRGAPVLRDVQHRDSEPAQPARREGHRRVGHDRFDARRAQRDRRRAVAPRYPPRRHALHRRARAGARCRMPTAGDSRPRETFSTPTLRLTESQYRTIVAHCYDGLPNEACGLFLGPVGADERTDRRAQRGPPDRERRRVGDDLHRRLARPAARRSRRRSARRGARRLLAQPHAHRRVPVAHRRAAGRVVSRPGST